VTPIRSLTPLERLQQARELRLVRSAWCEPEPGERGGWRQILSVEQGLALIRAGQATCERGTILRPAK